MNKTKEELADLLRESTLEFFGTAQHKVVPSKLVETQDVLLLDVRSREEFQSIAVTFGIHPNIQFLHIPVNEIPDRVDEIPSETNIVVFCPSNFRSTLVYAYLKMIGHESVRILTGGYPGLAELLMPGKVYKQVSTNR
ncbi:MAG: rhodanese-like domain-containing protein [Candidatus Thorarchaeota archaeon]